jgi:hypothetical protein
MIKRLFEKFIKWLDKLPADFLLENWNKKI